MNRRRAVQLPASVCCSGPGVTPVSQIFVECGQLFIVHSSDETPRHLLSQMIAIGVRASAHRGDEFLSFPLLYQVQPGSDGANLAWPAAVQVSAVALTAILKTGDIFSVLRRGSLSRCRDDPVEYRFTCWEQARTQHHEPQQTELIRGIHGCSSGRRLAAQVCDEGLYVFVTQFPGVGI